MDKSTIVCRCEEITVADIEDAVTQGAETFDDVKRLTRSGMGPCQAKTCQTSHRLDYCRTHSQVHRGYRRAAFRMPLRPVAMDVFATAQASERQES